MSVEHNLSCELKCFPIPINESDASAGDLYTTCFVGSDVLKSFHGKPVKFYIKHRINAVVVVILQTTSMKSIDLDSTEAKDVHKIWFSPTVGLPLNLTPLCKVQTVVAITSVQARTAKEVRISRVSNLSQDYPLENIEDAALQLYFSIPRG